MTPSREDWVNLMVSMFSEVHDEFTAIRYANEFYEQLMADASESYSESEIVQRCVKNLGEKLGLDPLEIRRKQSRIGKILSRKEQ